MKIEKENIHLKRAHNKKSKNLKKSLFRLDVWGTPLIPAEAGGSEAREVTKQPGLQRP